MTISFKPIRIIFSFLLLHSCGDQSNDIVIDNKKSRVLNPAPAFSASVKAHEPPLQINIADSVNYTDQNGLKQGLHITRGWKNKIICRANYINDTLQGYFWEWDGHIRDGYMVNGKKEGIFNDYYSEGYVMVMLHYKADSMTWSAPYIANQQRIVPVKDIRVYTDSIFLKIDHPNGKRWYEGLFLDRRPVGDHVVHDSLGVLKGVITYSTEIDTTQPWYEHYEKLTVSGPNGELMKRFD